MTIMMLRLVLLSAMAVTSSHAFTTTPTSTTVGFRRGTFVAPLQPLASTSPSGNDDDQDYVPFASRVTVNTAPGSSSSSSSSSTSDGGFDLSSITDNLPDALKNIDLSNLNINLGDFDFDAFREKIFGGQLGERGEAYVVAQFAAILFVIGGGIPVVGDLIFLLLGPVLMAAGLGVMVVATKDLGNALSPWPVPSGDTNLRTDGLYAYMRHPMYGGLLAACAGLSIVTGSATRLLLTALLLYVLDVKSDYEEAELTKIFPDYPAYKKQVTNKFFPQALLDELPWMAPTKKD